MRRIMRAISLVAVCFCLFGFIFCVVVMKAEAGDYIGEHCWNLTGSSEDYSGKMKLGISHLGGSHYLCSGIISFTGPSHPLPVKFSTHGNIEIIGNKFIITLSIQGKILYDEGGYTVGIDMYTITLDPQTLNGTVEGIGVYTDEIETTKGTVSYTTCQTE